MSKQVAPKKIIRRLPTKRIGVPKLQNLPNIDVTETNNGTSIPLSGCPGVEERPENIAVKVSRKDREKISARARAYKRKCISANKISDV